MGVVWNPTSRLVAAGNGAVRLDRYFRKGIPCRLGEADNCESFVRNGWRSMIPSDPDARLRRDACAEALTDAGFPLKPSTLASMGSRGTGPPFELWGRTPLYRWADALEWAERRLQQPDKLTEAG